ncbi:RNA-binding protein 5-A-like isoform X1 [Drosophila subpulchrella]|uniref:RNA-binding protein 5-A-like isoform X1 n=2 Tax=Drosophila subpulchrella TaxID=1486046 RepID=UPI0018A1904F|nr:RNA-binding protein 5-A-like isoform X1 [Drosophila subpulchrella]XP_037712003.1 RNA-binding protein 5-A-like isoform X1 [Drosophila subpulchrella]
MDSRYGRIFSGGNGNNGNESGYRRYTRSRSRSRERSRDRNEYRRRNSRSRSRERSSHYRHDRSPDRDLYRDLINEDYEDKGSYSSRNNYDHRQHRNEDNYDRRDLDSHGRRDHDSYNNHNRHDQNNYDQRSQDKYDNERDHRWKNYDRESKERNYDDFDRGSERSSRSGEHRQYNNNGNGNSSSNNRDRERERERQYSSDEDSDMANEFKQRSHHGGSNVEPLNNIILFGLKKHVTEADIMGELIKADMEPSSIRVMRKQPTGASRCFAFVEFKTVEEARQWMDLTQGVLQLGDHRVSMQYSHTRISDWTCVKCGASNFKRRFQCFMCSSSRAESENALSGAGEGVDEISRILTKKIMLRGLDALTNEEGVLTALQQHLPDLAKTVSKVLVSRDTLTQASRGICYLNFDTLVDSMNVFNGLTALDPPLTLDDKTVIINYCMDPENRQVPPTDSSASRTSGAAMPPSGVISGYTLADVPRLAEYSASVYASNPVEHAHYVQYYTDYYTTEISKNSGDPQLTEANSGAAVALSAIQRKQRKVGHVETTTSVPEAKAAFLARGASAPRGNDGKKYPTPDVSKYQYDETSGYYYDHITGLYYDAHSQYYYNNETGAYLYWDQKRSTYVLATPASTQAALQEVIADAEKKEEEAKKAKEKEKDKDEGGKHDKVKVAKKIVKDMEKWAKHLNQRKDYTTVATPQPMLLENEAPSTSRGTQGAYADVGFSILEKKERGKLNDYIPQAAPPAINKLVNAYGGPSDSEDDNAGASQKAVEPSGGSGRGVADESDYVDFQKLTCLLCKRAFQSLDILQKHLKMSNLHKENMAKLKLTSGGGAGTDEGLSYRDRAKERRLKYGESDPPPPNRSRERFEQEIKTLQTRQKDSTAANPAMPISSSNVGSRLMQKMGWSEGQGLGRKNQGRTQIIEADGRTNNVGLGNKVGNITPGNDYKSYIKKMMKQRYENA